MKKIEAIIRTMKFYDVKSSLEKAGCKGMTVSDVTGMGHQKGETVIGGRRPGSFKSSDLIPRRRIEILCEDGEVEKLISAISDAASTSSHGDGKIFVFDAVDVIRINDGSRGNGAVD